MAMDDLEIIGYLASSATANTAALLPGNRYVNVCSVLLLSAGPLTQFPHSLEPHLRQLGLPVMLKKGLWCVGGWVDGCVGMGGWVCLCLCVHGCVCECVGGCEWEWV